jgi:hypothetical protein
MSDYALRQLFEDIVYDLANLRPPRREVQDLCRQILADQEVAASELPHTVAHLYVELDGMPRPNTYGEAASRLAARAEPPN